MKLRPKAPAKGGPGEKTKLVRALARESLLAYAMLHNPEFQTPNHVLTLAHKLEDALRRVEAGEKVYMQVMMPPQNGKSTLTAEFFISWILGKHPDWGVAYATYAGDFAERRGGKIRDLCGSPQHCFVFPNFELSASTSAKAEWETTKGGGLKSVGRGGGLTGRPFKVVIIDDPFKDQAEADSKTIRESCKEWYHGSVETRQPRLTIIINTRWHVDDLSGYTLKELAHLNWEVVSFPAINADGESIWPEKYPIADLLNIKRGMKPKAWAALYQQTPYVEDGNLVNVAAFRRYTELPSGEPDHIVQTWDYANKKTELADYTVCETWYVYGAQAYLVDVLRKRMTFHEQKKAVVAQQLAWNASLILMEDKGNGIGLVNELQQTSSLPIVPIDPGTTDKAVRMSRCTDPIEGGQVFIPEDGTKPWLTDFVMEAAAFPDADHDDQVDAMSQFLDWFISKMRRMRFTFRTAGPTRNKTQNLMKGFTE